MFSAMHNQMPREAPDRFRTQILVARVTEPNYLADLTLLVNRNSEGSFRTVIQLKSLSLN
jgi:hypothetical protein